jgi:hypothetical protein
MGINNIESSSGNLLQPETLRIRNVNGQFTLSYTSTTSTEKISVQSEAGRTLAIHREPQGQSTKPAVDLDQKNGRLTFILGTGNKKRTTRASNVWLLLFIQPKEDRAELIGLLEMLRRDWKLADLLTNIETRLIEEAETRPASSRTHWKDLVAQLGDERFAKRQAADRALRAGGTAALSYLRQLNFEQLDAEQQFRVRRILDASTDQSVDDSVEQTVSSLIGEPLVWLTLSTRSAQKVRQTAVRQLSDILGEPVTIDPAATPDSQKEQREKLRLQIEGK